MEGSRCPSPAPSDLAYLCPTPVAAAFPSDVHTHSSDTASTNPEETFVQPIDASKAQAKVLAPLDTRYKPPPSAFSRDPALTPVMNVRDSVSTQQSGTSSSLYPLSTSTASGLTSPTPTSPQSMADELPEHLDEPSFVDDFTEVQDYDNDDVAYRLRLLVNNNYFLPPAHAKPSPASFAPPQPLHPPKKGTTPTFLDIFRVGKSKPKSTAPPGGPTSPFDPMAPMLRTAADSIAPTYPVGGHQTRTSAQIPRLSPQIPASATPRGRVVVVREKVTDIAVAAKQAEQDLRSKAAAAPHHQKSASHPQPKSADFFDDVIDPTDAVDIPLPSPSYPFAVQSSNLNALGVIDSLGADVLAEHLPPSKNPNLSYTYDPVEDSWRKALLHEAVHMSLDNSVTGAGGADTPDLSASSFSHSRVLGSSTPVVGTGAGSSRVQSPESAFSGVTSQGNTPALGSPTLPGPGANIGQRIVPQPMLHSRQQHQQHQRQKSNQSQKSTSTTRSKSNKNANGIRLVSSNTGAASSKLSPAAALNTSGSSALSLDVSRPSSFLPQRVDTPSGPMTPLAPPPRRPGGQYSPVVLQNAQWSHSQSELIPGHNHHHHHHHPYSAHPYASTRDDNSGGSNSNRTSNRFSRGSSVLSSTLPRLRRAVSSPSLAEGYDSHSSDFFHYNHHPVPPLHPSFRQGREDVPPLPTQDPVQRDSRATTMSFDTMRGSVSGSSVHEFEEDLGLQAERGRASFAAVGGVVQGSSSRSRSHSRLGGGNTVAGARAGSSLGVSGNLPTTITTTATGAGMSRPSLSVSEYSQSSMHSPSASTFQEDGDEDHLRAAGSVEMHAASSRFDLEHSQRERERERAGSSVHGHSAAQGRVPSVASRYTAMSPPPRISSSLAHVALPPPPRTSSLHYRLLEGNNPGGNGDGVRTSSDSGHYSHPFQTATEGDDDDDDIEEDHPPLPRVGRGGPGGFLQDRPATSSSARSAPTVPSQRRGHPFANVMLAPRPSTGPGAGSQSQARSSRMGGGAGTSPYGSLTPTVPLTLTIPTVDVPIEIHSAPGPSSPTSFFDSIQAQPNAMDDLDSSSDEDEEDEDNTASTVPPLPSHLHHPPQHPYTTPPHHLPRPTPASPASSGSGGRSPDPRARAVSSVSAKMTPPPAGVKAFGMKLGNFSTPYLKGGGMGESKQSLVLLHPPVEHSVNPKSPVCSSFSVGACSGGSENGHGGSQEAVDPMSPYDVYRHAQEQQQQQHSTVFTPPPPVASSGGSEASGSRRPSNAEESMRRLDGMLLRHMEDEKDTIKRIAAAVQVGATSSTSTPLRQHT